MIKNITMKNCASYDSTGVNIEDCDKINFIYGHNGSGKSTISNYLSSKSDEKYNDCCIVFENSIETDILVYNKTFREKNLQSTDMPGVFTLGEATAEQLAKLTELKKTLKEREKEYCELQTMLQAKKDEEKALSTEYEKNVWEQIFQKNDLHFKEAFAGCRSKKAVFVKRISDEYKIYKSSNLERKVIEEKADTIFGEKPEKLIKLAIPDFSIANIIYTYLRPNAIQLLTDSRKAARESVILEHDIIQFSENAYHICPWTGTKELATISNLFSYGLKEQLDIRSVEGGFGYLTFRSGLEKKELINCLMNLKIDQNNPDMVLAKDAAPKKDKYDYMVPGNLLRSAYLYNQVDVKSANNILNNLVW